MTSSRMRNLVWGRGPSETVLTGERPVRPARRNLPGRQVMPDIRGAVRTRSIRLPERPRMFSAGSDPIDNTAEPRMAPDQTVRTFRRARGPGRDPDGPGHPQSSWIARYCSVSTANAIRPDDDLQPDFEDSPFRTAHPRVATGAADGGSEGLGSSPPRPTAVQMTQRKPGRGRNGRRERGKGPEGEQRGRRPADADRQGDRRTGDRVI
jgi:hypothetical protein